MKISLTDYLIAMKQLKRMQGQLERRDRLCALQDDSIQRLHRRVAFLEKLNKALVKQRDHYRRKVK